MSHVTDEMRQCIEECAACHRTCLSAVHHCLEKGGLHAGADHIRMLLDCSQICSTSVDFMLRGSPLHQETCRVCAEICDACAQDCERMADDAEMQHCAETCRQCAESCRKSAGVFA